MTAIQRKQLDFAEERYENNKNDTEQRRGFRISVRGSITKARDKARECEPQIVHPGTSMGHPLNSRTHLILSGARTGCRVGCRGDQALRVRETMRPPRTCVFKGYMAYRKRDHTPHTFNSLTGSLQEQDPSPPVQVPVATT